MKNWTGVGVLVPLLCACGASESGSTGVSDGRSEQSEVDGDDAVVKAVTRDEIVLSPADDENSDVLAATLIWNMDTGKMRIEAGRLDEQAVAQFLSVQGTFALYGVFPWRLSFPKGIEGSSDIEPGVGQTFYLENDGVKLAVEFSYLETVVVLHGAELVE